jgi:hypothetical protein
MSMGLTANVVTQQQENINTTLQPAAATVRNWSASHLGVLSCIWFVPF